MRTAIITFLTVFQIHILFSQDLYFPPLNGGEWETLSPDSLNWCPDKIDELNAFLESENTKAFIILKGGKIVLEKYFNGFGPDSLWYWASAGKTVTATLTGIAQEEGFLALDDQTNFYLGDGWTNALPEKEDLITIRHQLSMTSGLDDGVSNVYCTEPNCLIYKADAGTRWAYHNGPYTNLTKVVEAASGLNYNTYYFTRLASKIGMNGLWIYVGYNRLLFSNARSMARFGLLIQNKGYWESTPILSDAGYFEEMINPSQNLNKSYGYLWWLNGQESYMLPGSQLVLPGSISPDAPSDVIAAMGANGQFLNISENENLLFVRLGNAPDSSLVPNFFNNQIWQHINDLECEPNSEKTPLELIKSYYYPNPTSNKLFWRVGLIPEEVDILDNFGRVLINTNDCQSLDLSALPTGVYWVKKKFREKLAVEMIIKN